MRSTRTLPALVAATLSLLAVSTGTAAATSTADYRCGAISISYVFDNDQTGGWWTVTTSMNCSPANRYKRYSLDIYDRPLTKQFVMETTGYVTGGYSKSVVIPATPISANKSACVSAHSEVYDLKQDVKDEESRNSCFKTAIP
ncbi:hypothetical protein [Kribbella sp. NPDC004536]|uniref:hypothetical protein n=1 Tax=Kribbella sp. NPDC004536 TaxID=3364106 RepID=UPI0036B51A71